MERPQRTLKIRDWSGLVSNRGPFAGKPGDTSTQVNCRCVKPGILEVRSGMRKVNWTL